MHLQQTPRDKAAGQKSSPSASTKAFLSIKTLKSTVLISGLDEGDYSSSGLQPGLCLFKQVARTPPPVMLPSAQSPHPAQNLLHTALQAPPGGGKVSDTKLSSPHAHAAMCWGHKAEPAPGPSYEIFGQGRPRTTWTWTSPFRQPYPTLAFTHINLEPSSSLPSLWQ